MATDFVTCAEVGIILDKVKGMFTSLLLLSESGKVFVLENMQNKLFNYEFA